MAPTQPDVPMAAGWTLVMYLALKDPRPKPLAAGGTTNLTIKL